MKLGYQINQAKHVLLKLSIIIAVLFSVACAPAKTAAAPTETPEKTPLVTPTSTPDPTPSPTPTPEPTPTPMPELTFEQKKALLGINESFNPPFTAAMIIVFNVSFKTFSDKAIEGRLFCGSKDRESDSKQINCFSITNDTYLFTLDFGDETSVPTFDFINWLGEYSPNFKELKLKNSALLPEMADNYRKWGLDYLNNSFLNNLTIMYLKNASDPLLVKLTGDELINLIIESTPQEEIIPFWVYTPGAQIPDELKGIYSEVDYPPATSVPTIPQ